jgi:hypothetical protein
VVVGGVHIDLAVVDVHVGVADPGIGKNMHDELLAVKIRVIVQSGDGSLPVPA